MLKDFCARKEKLLELKGVGPNKWPVLLLLKHLLFQTLFELKLRRFARRVQEFQRSFLPELARKLHRDARQLHPSLAEFALGDRSLAVAAVRLADKEAAVAKLSKWVQQKTPVSQSSPQFQ